MDKKRNGSFGFQTWWPSGLLPAQVDTVLSPASLTSYDPAPNFGSTPDMLARRFRSTS
jgi:hypothetical protein